MEESEAILDTGADLLANDGESNAPYESGAPESEECITPDSCEESYALSEHSFDESAELSALYALFPGASGKALSELVNEKRYQELRALGLNSEEAFLAAAKKHQSTYDNRTHLCGIVPKNVTAPKSSMTPREFSEARELFSGVSDEEIRSLYQRVTRQNKSCG